MNNGKLLNRKSLKQDDSDFRFKIIASLIVLIMPYIGLFVIIIKKPFSKKMNLFGLIYCILICLLLVVELPNQSHKNQSINSNFNTKSTVAKQTNAPFLRVSIEDEIKKLYSEGLSFSNLDYVQWNPMENGLYHCKNTFTGKMTKKNHSYLSRVGYDKHTKTSTLYYLKIDGNTVFWDEEGETAFIEKK